MARLTGLERHVLRYWESEFPQIRPDKGKSGQRIYKQKDLDAVLRVKQLLYQEGYTISGARKKMNSRGEQDVESVLESAKRELREILELLK